MTINRQFDDVDVRGALIRAPAALLGAEHNGLLPWTLLEFRDDSC